MIDKKMGAENTIIGDTIVIRGNVQGDEDLTIKGRVEGSITLTRDLFIETSGIVKADVNVQNIFISGVLVGNVTASQLVEISADGRMVGNISAPRVVIIDGASYRGRIEMGEATEGFKPVARPRPVSRPGMRPFPPRPAPAPAAPKPAAPVGAPPAKPGEGAKPSEKPPEKPLGPGGPPTKPPEGKGPEGKGPEVKPPAPGGPAVTVKKEEPKKP